MLDEFQKAKLIEWAEWCLTHGEGPMPCGVQMVDQWAFWVATEEPFPTREQFAERQNRVTFEAI